MSHRERRRRALRRAPAEEDRERAYYSLNRRVYRVLAPLYDVIVFPAREVRREVVRAAGLRPGSRVLDVATGTGAQAFAFAETAREVIGIDHSPEMLGVARRKNHFPHVAFEQADATKLPFKDRSFDAACISFALHEMPNSIRRRVLREMARVTRPGGSILVVDYALPPGRVAGWVAYHVVKLYERESFVSFVKLDMSTLLDAAGIELMERRAALRGLVAIFVGKRKARPAFEAWGGADGPGHPPL